LDAKGIFGTFGSVGRSYASLRPPYFPDMNQKEMS